MTSKVSCRETDDIPSNTGSTIDSHNSLSALIAEDRSDNIARYLVEQPLLAAAHSKLAELKLIAGELFGPSDAEFRCDPEIDGLQTLVITAEFDGTSDESRSLRREWHRRIHGVVGDAAARVQLLVDLKPHPASA